MISSESTTTALMMDAQERWIPIQKAPRYAVSDLGNVRNKYGEILCQGTDRDGYRDIILWHDGKRKRFRINRLVLIAFTGEEPDGFHAAHEDGKKENNRLDNLRWKTPAENIADKIRHGTISIGEASGSAQLSLGKVIRIKRMLADGLSVKSISDCFSVGKDAIYRIKNGQAWSEALAVSGAAIPKFPSAYGVIGEELIAKIGCENGNQWLCGTIREFFAELANRAESPSVDQVGEA